MQERDDEDAARATLIENIQRVDLDPLETAEAFKRLIDVFRMTQEEVADKSGKKRSTVANYLRLLTLPDAMKQALSSGQMTMGHAKAILSLESEELQQTLHRLIDEKKLSVRETEKQSRKLTSKKRKGEVHLQAVEEAIQEKLQTKVTLSSGKLTVHYYDLDGLEALLRTLNVDVDAEEKQEAF